jgi:hypothetical protein
MQSIDACPGSLAAIGYARSDADVQEAEAAAAALANADELRERQSSSTRPRATIEQPPQE